MYRYHTQDDVERDDKKGDDEKGDNEKGDEKGDEKPHLAGCFYAASAILLQAADELQRMSSFSVLAVQQRSSILSIGWG